MSKKLLIMIAGGVVLLGGGGGAAYYLTQSDDPEAVVEEVEEPAGLLELEQFLTNVHDPSGERYARLTVKLAIVPRPRADEIKADSLVMARMRDGVLTLITGKTFEELSDPAGKEIFRAEIQQRLNSLVEDGRIREVLFSDFVVQ